jgi:hypothetical protein
MNHLFKSKRRPIAATSLTLHPLYAIRLSLHLSACTCQLAAHCAAFTARDLVQLSQIGQHFTHLRGGVQIPLGSRYLNTIPQKTSGLFDPIQVRHDLCTTKKSWNIGRRFNAQLLEQDDRWFTFVVIDHFESQTVS